MGYKRHRRNFEESVTTALRRESIWVLATVRDFEDERKSAKQSSIDAEDFSSFANHSIFSQFRKIQKIEREVDNTTKQTDKQNLEF